MSNESAGELARSIYPRLNVAENKHDQLERRVDILESNVDQILNKQTTKSKYTVSIIGGASGAAMTALLGIIGFLISHYY